MNWSRPPSKCPVFPHQSHTARSNSPEPVAWSPLNLPVRLGNHPPPPPHTHAHTKKNVASLFSVCIELYVPFLPVCKDKFIVQQVPFITHHTHFQIIDYSRIASINGKICCRPSWFYGICCRTPQKRVFTTDHASLKLTCQNILWSLF